MLAYDRYLHSKKLRQPFLRKPKCFIVKDDFYLDVSSRRVVKNDFIGLGLIGSSLKCVTRSYMLKVE